MSRDVCTTCGKSVRDYDQDEPGVVAALREHGCALPRGTMPWNDGEHVSVEDPDGWQLLDDPENHDPGDEDRS